MEKLKNLLCFTSLCMFIGYFSYRNTALLNMGAYSSLILSIYILHKERGNFRLLSDIYHTNKALVIAALTYILYLVATSILFSYKGLINLSISALFDDVRYALILLFIYLALNTRRTNEFIFISLIITSVFIVFCMPIINFFFTPYNPLPMTLKFRYGYNLPFTVLYPFVLSLIFYRPKRSTYTFVAIFSITLFAIIITSGGRGSFLAVTIELAIFIAIYVFSKKMKLTKIILIGISTFSMIFLILTISFFSSALVKSKVLQNFNDHDITSGRTELIETRFPIFIEHSSILFGTGYGNEIYQHFLEDHHAPKVVGMNEIKNGKEIFSYFHDEPQLLVVFYESGLIGLILFLIFICCFLPRCYQHANTTRLSGMLSISIGVSMIGNSLILGIVEHTSINNLIFLLIIFMLSTTMQIKMDRNEI